VLFVTPWPASGQCTSPVGVGRYIGARPAVLLVFGSAPMPKLLGFYALPPANRAREATA